MRWRGMPHHGAGCPRPRASRRLLAFAEQIEPRVLLSTYTVTNLNNSGPGSLIDSFQRAFGDSAAVVRFDPALFANGTPRTIQWFSGVPIDAPEQCTIVGPGTALLTFNMLGTISPGPGGTLTIKNVTITGNGWINQGGTLNVENCTFTGVQTSPSNRLNAALVNDPGGGTLNVTNTTFTNNFCVNGGAIDNLSSASVVNCIFIGNSSQNPGGAIFSQGPLAVVNSTFTNNSGPRGGAIWEASSSPAALLVSNCTISANRSAAGGAVDGPATINNSIVARNTLDDGHTPADISGTVTGSNNLIGTGGSGGLVNGANGNIVGVADPKLGPLGNNGGPTQTIPLLPGSPALDAGSNALAVDGSGNPLTTDQRGLPRVFNGTVDIGAYEAQSPAVAADVNHDGTVNFSDLLALAQHYGSSAQPMWEGGDLTGDGSVAFSDLLLLAQNYGRSAPAAAAAIRASP